MKDSNDQLAVVSASESPVGSPSSSDSDGEPPLEKKSLRTRIRAVVWDSFDRSPEERRFIAKIDFFILTWAGFTYFSKNLNTNNICSPRCGPLFWVIVTFATSAVKNTHQLYACRFLKLLALDRMKRAGKQLEEPFTWRGAKRILKKWHFWVYTTYYTFFICSENIGSYMNLWLKSLDRYTVPEINTYPTVINAITIITTLCYGWTSDSLQVRAPIVYFSLAVCFFAAMNLAIWDGVPFGLKWASFYLTGFAQGSGPVFLTMVNEHCAGDSLERKIILGSTNSVAYAFNAWIPLLTYNTTYAPRFLVGNSTTVAFIKRAE
ncbi:hypothetical protein SLS63_010400 [Diaporthe eres]|uniref:Pantothenate transporter n=1 Tax=Diaporthe eres TaxID=83184 RepID=A0ABR1NX46_DIAER